MGTNGSTKMQTKKGRSRRRWLPFLAVAAVMANWAAVFALSQATNNALEPAAYIQRGMLEQTVEADGLIEAFQKAEVHAPSGLRVLRIAVREGDRVKEGDLLAELDTESLALEIQRAELNIQSAEANMSNEQRALANSVTSARNAVSSAAVSLQAAQREYDILLARQNSRPAVIVARINLDAATRAHEYNLSLFDIGGVSRESLNQSKNALDKAQTAYDDAVQGSRDSLDRARESLAAAQIRKKSADDVLSDAIEKNTNPAAIALELQKVAYHEKLLRLRDAAVTAPISGIVTLVNAKKGAPASGLMFVIEDDGDLVVRARVGEADMAAISYGVACRIRPAGRDLTLHGAITLIPYTAERDPTGAFSAAIGDDAFFIVEASIDDARHGALIGMNAKVSFVVDSRDSCFYVPNGLIFRNGDQKWILTRSWDGRVREIPVSTGLETRRMTEIIGEGIEEGLALFSRR